jgi:hypothetical protein
MVYGVGYFLSRQTASGRMAAPISSERAASRRLQTHSRLGGTQLNYAVAKVTSIVTVCESEGACWPMTTKTSERSRRTR